MQSALEQAVNLLLSSYVLDVGFWLVYPSYVWVNSAVDCWRGTQTDCMTQVINGFLEVMTVIRKRWWIHFMNEQLSGCKQCGPKSTSVALWKYVNHIQTLKNRGLCYRCKLIYWWISPLNHLMLSTAVYDEGTAHHQGLIIFVSVKWRILFNHTHCRRLSQPLGNEKSSTRGPCYTDGDVRQAMVYRTNTKQRSAPWSKRIKVKTTELMMSSGVFAQILTWG